MEKPKSAVGRSFALRKPASSLAVKRVVSARVQELAARDVSKQVLRLLTATKPDPKKFAGRLPVKKGLTISQILSRARSQQIDLAMSVVIRNVRKVYHKRSLNPVILAETFSKKTGKDARGYDRYVTYVEALPTKSTKFSETRVKVSCSCPFFTFFSEYALAKYGSADIQFSNGEAPVVRNPSEKPWCCKHAIKLLWKISEKGI